MNFQNISHIDQRQIKLKPKLSVIIRHKWFDMTRNKKIDELL